MTNIRLQNIARLSVLYLSCLLIILTLSKIGLDDSWATVIGALYLIAIVILEKFGAIRFFKKIAFAGCYTFISLVGAHYAFNTTDGDSYASLFSYIMIANFLFSCGYLIYVLHTFNPHPRDAES